MQQDRSLAAQDLALRGELGRGELAERVTAGQQGRALDRDRLSLQEAEVFGEGRGQRYGGRDTLQSRLASEDRARQANIDRGNAATMMQMIPEGYKPSEVEADIIGQLLGIDEQRFGGGDPTTMSEEDMALYNPYGYRLTGGQAPVNPNTGVVEEPLPPDNSRSISEKLGSPGFGSEQTWGGLRDLGSKRAGGIRRSTIEEARRRGLVPGY
jgi:hypothetical protein